MEPTVSPKLASRNSVASRALGWNLVDFRHKIAVANLRAAFGLCSVAIEGSSLAKSPNLWQTGTQPRTKPPQFWGGCPRHGRFATATKSIPLFGGVCPAKKIPGTWRGLEGESQGPGGWISVSIFSS